MAKGEREAQANAEATSATVAVEGKGTSEETHACSASAASPAYDGDGQSKVPQAAPAPQNEAKLPRGWSTMVHEGAPYVVCVPLKRRCATTLEEGTNFRLLPPPPPFFLLNVGTTTTITLERQRLRSRRYPPRQRDGLSTSMETMEITTFRTTWAKARRSGTTLTIMIRSSNTQHH